MKSGGVCDHDDHRRRLRQFYWAAYADKYAGEKRRDYHFEVSRVASSTIPLTVQSYRGRQMRDVEALRRCYLRCKSVDALEL